MSTAAGSGSPSGEPERVNVHDFPDPKAGQGDPYGVYDLGRNTGWVGVGTDHDTAGFAVATLRRWWQQVGSLAGPRPTGCWSVPMLAAATATGSGPGRPSWPGWRPRPGGRSRSATCRQGPPRGTGSSIGCSARSR
jgi:hypothetical protein